MREDFNLADALGPIGWIFEFAVLALSAATLISILLFPIAWLISWTFVLGSRIGWWRTHDERKGVE